MPLTKLEYEKSWTDGGDFPTYEADEEQVRADMQYHPDAIRDYINETLLRELASAEGAENIGDGQQGSVAASLEEAFRRLDAADSDIKNLASGESPEAVRAAVVSFTAEGWTEDEGGCYALRILQSQHRRLSDAFGYKLQHLVNGTYRVNSWAIAGTEVSYDTGSGDVVLTGEHTYAGRITFFGV